MENRCPTLIIKKFSQIEPFFFLNYQMGEEETEFSAYALLQVWNFNEWCRSFFFLREAQANEVIALEKAN